MKRIARPVAAAVALAGSAAFAYPEGAPWGTANPEASETCASCHYDYEPVFDSTALEIEGLPAAFEPGVTYPLVIRLSGVDAAISGFQLLATSSGSAGSFRADASAIEVIGAASRSTESVAASDGASWRLAWQAPADGCSPIRLYLAASAANDDQSPFGDTVHYRQFVVARGNDN